MNKLRWQPLLCYTPATGRLARYAPVKTRCIAGVKFEWNQTAVVVPEEWRAGLGSPEVWKLIDQFRVTGEVLA
jgi:hypothetical protein